MIAQSGAGIDGEDEMMNYQVENSQFDNQPNMPDEPDESWWSSLLIDEPIIDENPEETEYSNMDDDFPMTKDDAGPSVKWEKIQLLFEKDEIITLSVVGVNKGGVLVQNSEIKGFVPASHLIEFPANFCEEDREFYLSCYLDRKISLKVIEFEPEKERVVFSERAALAGAGQRKELLQNLAEGDIVRGSVTNITSFGAFIDLGGVEGLIHISELSWGRVQHPSQILEIGEQVEAIVIDISEAQGRIALSLKRLTKNPWMSLSMNLDPGDIVDAEISSIEKYGAFARLDNGVEGLIHISSLEIPDDCQNIDDFLSEGQFVRVSIVNLEPQKRRLGLKLESY